MNRTEPSIVHEHASSASDQRDRDHHAADLCPASARLKTGTTDGPWYATLMPFEHYDSQRSQQFPHTCTVRRLAGGGAAVVQTRSSVADYPNPYNLVTRERDELFVYGGYVGEENGAYVARIDPESLCEQWRIYFRVARDDYFNWPGVVGVHGNGYLYAVAGNILAKIDAASAAHSSVRLPEHPGGGGAAYNGFVISEGGVLIMKSMERGGTEFNSLAGLRAVAHNGIPAFLVAVDPDDLSILAVAETPEPVLGRVTTGTHDGQEYVYCPGSSRVWRYRYTGRSFILDETWNPLYVEGEEQPGTACGIMNDWVIVQTNFLRSSQPLRISAFHVRDAARSHTFVPFPDGTPSQEFSKPGLDAENMRVYTSDQLAGRVTGLDFDPESGFRGAWEAKQTMASFWAIVGPPEERNIIGTDFSPKGDRVIWRNAADGAELAASDVVDPKLNGNIVSSGFRGRFYYQAVGNAKVVELTFGDGGE